MVTVYNDLLAQAFDAKKKQDKDAALALYKKAIAYDPTQFPAYKEAAIICKDLKLIDEAITLFDQALSIKPKDVFVEVQKAVCVFYQGNSQACLDQLMALAEKNPSNWVVAFEIAMTFKALNDLESTQLWLQKVLDLAPGGAPGNLNTLLELAYLARSQNNSELAAEWFLAIIQHYPANVRAYLEYATELQALGKPGEAAKTLKSGVVYSHNQMLFEKYLLGFFDVNPLVAAQELLLQAPYYRVGMEINRKLLSYLIGAKEVINLTELPITLASNLFANWGFIVRVMNLKVDQNNNLLRLLAYFEPLLETFIESQNESLVKKDLFVFLLIVAALKENNKLKQYVVDHVGDYVALLGFNEICICINALRKSIDDDVMFDLFAKSAIEKQSIDALLFCLIIIDYYPEYPALSVFSDRDRLLKALPSFHDKNPAILKNILIHLLQKGLLSSDQLEALNVDIAVKDAVKVVDAHLKPFFRPNFRHYAQPKKLKVALCISGQLRGYREAYESLKAAFIDPLQPDIYIHTWQDAGFKEPHSSSHADRVFSGHFLGVYKKLFYIKNYSYPQIKQLLPSVFSLLQNNTAINKAQLQAFYQTESIEIEDDASLPFSALSNRDKMFYKIHACNQLVAKSGKTYDLVIRLRPDMVFSLEEGTDWKAIADICNSQKVILANSAGVGFSGFRDYGEEGYGIGDSFAISSQAGIDFYANVGMSINAFREQGLAYFSVHSSHTLLGHGLWLGGYRRQQIPFANKTSLVNISLKAKDISQVIQKDLVHMDKDLANDFMDALALDMAGVPYKDPFHLEKFETVSELQPIALCSPSTTKMLEQQILAQFDQDAVIASYDMMLHSKYYDFGPELIGRYLNAIMNGAPVAPLAANANLALDFISSDGFVNAILKMKNTEPFGKLSAFFSTFILEAVADVRVKSKNLDLLAEMLV